MELENVEVFKYLSYFVSLQYGDLKEISASWRKGDSDLGPFRKFLEEQTTPPKCRLYIALMFSVVLDSSEMWTIFKSTERKLESFHCSCLRRILFISHLKRVTNKEVLARSLMSALSALIMIKRGNSLAMCVG